MEAPGLMLAQLNGSAAGQTVPHFHMHIIPRHKGLEMLGHGTEIADMAELADIATRSAPPILGNFFARLIAFAAGFFRFQLNRQAAFLSRPACTTPPFCNLPNSNSSANGFLMFF